MLILPAWPRSPCIRRRKMRRLRKRLEVLFSICIPDFAVSLQGTSSLHPCCLITKPKKCHLGPPGSCIFQARPAFGNWQREVIRQKCIQTTRDLTKNICDRYCCEKLTISRKNQFFFFVYQEWLYLYTLNLLRIGLFSRVFRQIFSDVVWT